MTRTHRRIAVLSLAAAAALGGTVLATSGPDPAPGLVLSAAGSTGSQAGGCAEQGSCLGLPKSFGVTVTDVTGLYPGRETTVPVGYSNPNSFAIRVTSATVSATGTSRCPGSHLRTGTYQSPGGTVVPRNGSVQTRLPIGLLPSAPDSCKGARFTLTVSATAVKE